MKKLSIVLLPLILALSLPVEASKYGKQNPQAYTHAGLNKTMKSLDRTNRSLGKLSKMLSLLADNVHPNPFFNKDRSRTEIEKETQRLGHKTNEISQLSNSVTSILWEYNNAEKDNSILSFKKYHEVYEEALRRALSRAQRLIEDKAETLKSAYKNCISSMQKQRSSETDQQKVCGNLISAFRDLEEVKAKTIQDLLEKLKNKKINSLKHNKRFSIWK